MVLGVWLYFRLGIGYRHWLDKPSVVDCIMTEDEVYTEIGRRVRIIRKWRGMNQRQVMG